MNSNPTPKMNFLLPGILQTRLDLIIQTIPRFWEQKHYSHFTYQGVAHSRRVYYKVIDIAQQLAEDSSLSSDEAFILAAASWLYEIGFQSQNLKPPLSFDFQPGREYSFSQLLEIRSNKHLLTERLIWDSLRNNYKGIPIYLGLLPPVDDYIRCIVEVCKWCSDEPLTNAPDIRAVHGQNIRLGLLSAILRLADKLYIDGARIDLSVLPKFHLPRHEFARWAVYPYVQTLPIENKQIRFFYSLPESKNDLLGNIRAIIESPLQSNANEEMLYLWDRGLHLTLHNTPIVSFDQFENYHNPIEQEVISALQEIGPIKQTSIEYTGKTTTGVTLNTIKSNQINSFHNPKISVSLLTQVYPTAYCYHLDASSYPFVKVHIDNNDDNTQDVTLRVKAFIEDKSDLAVTTLNINKGKQTSISLLPLLKQAALKQLTEICPASLQIVVDMLLPQAQTLYDQSTIIHLQASNTAVLGVSNSDGTIIDLTDYLAAWVTPRHSEIEKCLRKAIEYHQDRRFIGYQGASTLTEAAGIVREQARAIYLMLKQTVGLTYINSTFSLGANANQITQRVRLPRESLATGGAANCIDGAVLFASFLEIASIEPLIIIMPGHAYVGWRVWRGTESYEFLETTMIGYSDFDSAQKVAQELYDKAVFKGYFKHNLFSQNEFARIIDVSRCRSRGIYPFE